MVDFWVDFISTGNPNILQGQWSPFEKEHKYLNISGLHSFMGNSESLQERMDLWEEIMSNKTSLETTTQSSTINPTTTPTRGPTVCLETNKDICFMGSWMTTTSDYNATFASFQGIQYAQAPIEGLRFKSPVPHQETNGVHDVSKKVDILCTQFGALPTSKSSEAVEQEDCLLLNIYAPEIAFDDLPLPVLVWIHGGGLQIGSGRMDEYGPHYFMDTESVIVVTVNYRLGPFGFLSMGTEEVPGNAGFRDQTMALKWVNDNIATFGGDPEAIAIAGESAGSWSVAMHLVSPKSKGLFKRAILQSGTALGTRLDPNTPEEALTQANQVYEALGCMEVEGILSCLQSKDVGEFLNMTSPSPWLSWHGVPDNDFTTDPFLPGRVEELLASKQFNSDIEVIIGTNADEGILDVGPATDGFTEWDSLKDEINEYGPTVFFGIPPKEFTSEDVTRVNALIDYYVGSIENINEEHKQGVIDMFTDASFQYGTHQTINHLVDQNVTVYQYLLTYQGKYSISPLFDVSVGNGVCHGDDLIYFWNSSAMGTADISSVLGNILNILSFTSDSNSIMILLSSLRQT